MSRLGHPGVGWIRPDRNEIDRSRVGVMRCAMREKEV